MKPPFTIVIHPTGDEAVVGSIVTGRGVDGDYNLHENDLSLRIWEGRTTRGDEVVVAVKILKMTQREATRLERYLQEGDLPSNFDT